MEDGIENCHEWSLQAANQVLLLFGPIENQDGHQRGT
jgi:hypothetical protein